MSGVQDTVPQNLESPASQVLLQEEARREQEVPESSQPELDVRGVQETSDQGCQGAR